MNLEMDGYNLAVYTEYRLEPTMVKNLPIIPSQTSQKFYTFSKSSPIVPLLFF